MIYKEIKEYKQGNKTIQRINILKSDAISGRVVILTTKEHEYLQSKIKNNAQIIAKKEKEIKHLYEKINQIEDTNKTINQVENTYKETINDLNKQYDKNINQLTEQQHEHIKDFNKQHQNQLKEIYDKFNEDITQYIKINQLQNTALKQILELGFIDIIKNKHKKIAKDQIKELDKKTVYELVPKKED